MLCWCRPGPRAREPWTRPPPARPPTKCYRPQNAAQLPCWADCLSLWCSTSKPLPAVTSSISASVTPHSPNTCIYNKVLNRVSPDLEWAQAGAASPVIGCSCVPGSELDPASGLQVPATCLGRLGLPCVTLDQHLALWHQETQQSNWTQICPEKAALVIPSPSPTQPVVTDLWGQGCGIDEIMGGALLWGCPAVFSGGAEDCEVPPQTPEAWLELGLCPVTGACLSQACGLTWLRIQTCVKTQPAPLLGALWYIPGSSPKC